MRLICGLVRLDGQPVEEALLRRMAAQIDLADRRPAMGLWRGDAAGLLVLDYAARTPAAFALPEREGSVIAGDVRLDAPEPLRGRAGAGAAAPDDALLLAALTGPVPVALDAILGDYAFALWNPARRQLLLGRDAVGTRPLAFAWRPGEFLAFASFPKAIHGSGLVPHAMDEGAVARRIARVMSDRECLMAGIERLPPAHRLDMTPAGIAVTRYWQLDRARLGSAALDPEQAAQELRQRVAEAVRSRLGRAGAQTAAHLSGGLDSSAVAVLAARALRERGERLHAYSMLDRPRNDMTSEDETEFVRAVVDQEADLDWRDIRAAAGVTATPDDMDVDRISPFVTGREEASLCADAAGKGVDLILTGLGGDEAASYGGAGLVGEMLLRGRWRAAAREIALVRRAERASFAQVLYREVIRHVLPRGLDALLRGRRGPPTLGTAFVRSLRPEVGRRHRVTRGSDPVHLLDARTVRWQRITSPHLVDHLERLALLGARHGLAYSHPLLDRRVIEFALSLPSELYRDRGTRRRVFRDAMTGILPERVRQRTDKLAPFPLRPLEFVDHKDELVARMEACARSPEVRRLIDLDLLRCQLEVFPTSEQLRAAYRDPGGKALRDQLATVIAAVHTLASAEYILQHGGEIEAHPNVALDTRDRLPVIGP